MAFLLGSTSVEIFCALVLVLWILYKKLTQAYPYWKEKGIPSIKPVFPFGSTWDMFLGRMHVGQMYQQYYQQFKGERYFGIHEALKPVLVVGDPELVKQILTRDFHSFNNRFIIPINKDDHISFNLFNMCDQEWRNMRIKLVPAFSSGKLKMMYLLMEKCGENLKDYIADHLKNKSAVDIKDCLARFTMDIIATCAFGLEINSLKERDCDFYKVGMRIFQPSLIAIAKRFLAMSLPFFPKQFIPRLAPIDISDFFTKIIRDTVEYRERNSVIRNDFLDLLIKVRQNKSLYEDEEQMEKIPETFKPSAADKTGLTVEEIAGQSFIFFAAGFETASSTMTFCLYELACNPEIQEKLHQEIEEVLAKNEGKPTYQALQEMTYLDQVVNETLRRYSSVSVLFRMSNENYKVPDSNLILEKGQRIAIPTYAIHHDPQYYPEPYKFDPERFSAERIRERHQYVYLPFGEGPRMCIGMRFGLLQTKIGLTELVSTFKFELTPETPVPVSFHKRSFLTQPAQPIHLHVTQRKTLVE